MSKCGTATLETHHWLWNLVFQCQKLFWEGYSYVFCTVISHTKWCIYVTFNFYLYKTSLYKAVFGMGWPYLHCRSTISFQSDFIMKFGSLIKYIFKLVFSLVPALLNIWWYTLHKHSVSAYPLVFICHFLIANWWRKIVKWLFLFAAR